MKSEKFVEKIKSYAFVSFIIPLIAINTCFFIYKFLGNIDTLIYPNLNWDKNEHSYTYTKYSNARKNLKEYKFTNCSKYKYNTHFITIDNESIKDTSENAVMIQDLASNNKFKSVVIKTLDEKALNYHCINNYSSYSFIKKSSFLESIFVKAILNNPSGFSKIKNPYFYGEVSISRTARYFPSIIVFKTLIILSAFLLFLYWKNNLNLFNEFKNKNILDNFAKNFYYLGILSCICLALHAAFLGLDFDSKLFTKIRRLIIILFIFFELAAQISLTVNLFKFKGELQEYIKPLILKIKIIFLIIIFSITCIAFVILAFGDPSTAFKHILEWNYFSLLLFYYLLSRLLWKTP